MKLEYKTILVLFMTLLGACTKDFEKINTNPNSPETTNTEFLMSEVVLSTAYAYQENAVGRRPASAARYLTLVAIPVTTFLIGGLWIGMIFMPVCQSIRLSWKLHRSVPKINMLRSAKL